METTKIMWNNADTGEVQLLSDDKKAGVMEIARKDGKLIVYHTEIDPAYEGKGFALLLLNQLVSYAREHALKITALCPYVHLQFKRRSEEYKDVWGNQ